MKMHQSNCQYCTPVSGKLNKAIKQLLKNKEDKGTVVRWATAMALGEILKLEAKT